MEYILPTITIFLLLASILHGFYYGLFFKKMIYCTLHKPKSKTLFWLKFFLPAEDMRTEGGWNVHVERNDRLFGKNWRRISGVYIIGLYLGTAGFLIENSHQAQELVIQPIQQQDLQYVSAKLITEKNNTKKPHFYISTKDEKYKFNDYIYKTKNPLLNIYLQLVKNNTEIQVAYMPFPYLGFFKTDKLLSLKTKDGKEIIKFSEVKQEILSRDIWIEKYAYYTGVTLLLLAIIVLPIRYYLYGFYGVDKLIEVKHKELQRYGKFIHRSERYMSEEDILSGTYREEIEINKGSKKWL